MITTKILLSSALLVACVFGASAQVTKVTSRAALAGNLSIDWREFGKDGQFISTPFSRHFGHQKVTLGSSSGGLILRREATTWHGDFLPGQYLMTQPYQSDNFLISFSPPVMALGTQIDPGSQQGSEPPYTGYFVARLCLFGTKGNFLGLVQRSSTADANETGSARFLGARSVEPIGYVSLLVSGVTTGFKVEGDLAANQMDVVTITKKVRVAAGVPASTPPACR
jgi:hypothetical protein